MELEFKAKDFKTFSVEINNKHYSVTPRITVGDIFYIYRGLKEEHLDTIDVLSNTIAKHCQSTDNTEISVGEIKENKAIIEKFVNGVLDTDETINKHYEALSSQLAQNDRFVNAIIAYYDESAKKLAEVIANEFLPAFQDIVKPLADFKKAFAPVLQALKDFNKVIDDSLSSLKKALSGISIPSFSDEEKQALIDSFTQWGKYGWTIIPDGDYDLFFTAPQSQHEANKIADKIMNKDSMDRLFEETLLLDGVKKDDYNEAVFLYQNQKYKSCAMMLFSLIDAKFIRMHKKEETSRKRRRDTGYSAADIVLKRLDKEFDLSQKFIYVLTYGNLLSCIKEFFKYGDDFKVKTTVINRNLLDHGMTSKKVRKRDCKQLFLLYYNILQLLNIIK